MAKLFVKSVFLHVPKTGGTAIRNYIVDHHDTCEFRICASHDITLSNIMKDVAVVVTRDPLERFCSGFWSRKNYHLRQSLDSDNQYKKYQRPGGQSYTDFEKDILSKCATPDELLSLLRTDSKTQQALSISKSPLELLLRSLTYWLGDLETFKQQEYKVSLAFDMAQMTPIMLRYFNADLSYQDAFVRRSKDQFGFAQSYEVSNENVSWFTNSYRAEDYQLTNYIKQQFYFKSI